MQNNLSLLARRRVLNPRYQGEIAAAETNGDVSGDYGQIEQIMLDDLAAHAGFPKLTVAQVLANRDLYQAVIEAYWNRLGQYTANGVGMPESSRALWWLMPGRYHSTKGDVNKVPKRGKLRNIMQNRVKNINKYRANVSRNEALMKQSMERRRAGNTIAASQEVQSLGAASQGELSAR